MNSFERVMNTIQCLPVDRVPVLAVLNVLSGTWTDTPLKNIYTEAPAYIASQSYIVDTIGIDMVLTTFDYSVIGEAFGCEVSYFENQAPNIRRPISASVDEFIRRPLPDPAAAGRLPMVLECSRALASRYQGEVPLFAAIPGPCSLPALIFGLEKWLDLLLFDETKAQRVLRYTADFFVAWCNALLAAGNTAVIFTEAVAAKEVIYRELFINQFLPHLRDLFPAINGPIIFHHTGGSINHVIDLLPQLPGLLAVAVGSKDSLAEARARLGPKLALIGNLDNLSFPAMGAQEVYDQSLSRLGQMGRGGGYFLSNSGADLPMDTPVENVKAMLRASQDFGAAGSPAGSQG